jgi:ATP-binding cassette subfamily F protein uup
MAAATERSKSAPQRPPPDTSRRKLSYKDQRDFETIEARIAEAEARLAALEVEQASPVVASNASRLVELMAKVDAAKAEIDALYSRWSELEVLRAG